MLLDENGNTSSSPQLAYYLEKLQNSSVKRLALIIGGSYGVNREVVDKCNVEVSLSRMVFPHQIVRLLVVEQLYRAFSINHGSKYHHE